MKIRKSLGLLFTILVAAQFYAQAQPTRYIVKFKNKGGSTFSLMQPTSFLSAKSIERRTRFNIALDSTDLPVAPAYLDSLRKLPNVTILNASKWLNQVSIQTTNPAALAIINQYPFVQSAVPIATKISFDNGGSNGKFEEEPTPSEPSITNRTTANFFNYGASYKQVHIHNGEFLHNIGLRGQNILIGMMDAGFQNYLSVKAFDSARANGQILGTYDFVANEASVNEDNSHGMQCLSTIAANIPGQFVGTAPKAFFYLFRTEDAGSEYPIEEHNWVCGAERLDSAGSDLISSSLGYYDFDAPFNTPVYNYTYADMNGNTTAVAIGADLAAKKGMLVINSAGNNGNNAWRYIISPADGDSVLAVGAVDTSGVVGGFSSYGPSSDGQIKPDVASVGVRTVVQFPGNTIATNNGTSFAAPNLAGLAACLWQGFPEYNNMKIINALRQSGSIVSTPNDRIGYGIPDVKKALTTLTQEFSTASAQLQNCKTNISWRSKDEASMKYVIERKIPGETSFTPIANVAGSGAVFGTRNHQYSDSLINMPVGTILYRIRQFIDTTNSISFYIDTVTVNLATACVPPVVPVIENSVLLLPNPTTGNAQIRISSTEAVQNLQVQVFDAAGKRVLIQTQNITTGITNIPLRMGNLARGKYFVTIYKSSVRLTTKELIKL